MANLITRMHNMEIVWNNAETDAFYNDFMVKLTWRFSGNLMDDVFEILW